MKKITILLAAAIYTLHSMAQTTSPSIIASSGWYATGAGITLSQTIGEMALVQTFKQGGTVLTQGFQQPETISTGLPGPEADGGSLLLFPNPATDDFDLQYSFPEEGELTAGIYNVAGQKVSRDYQADYNSGQQLLHLSGSELMAGLYFVRTVFITVSGVQYETTRRVEIIK